MRTHPIEIMPADPEVYIIEVTTTNLLNKAIDTIPKGTATVKFVNIAQESIENLHTAFLNLSSDIKAVDLSYELKNMNYEQITAVCSGLSKSAHVHTLNLSNNDFGRKEPRELQEIASCLTSLKQLTDIDLSKNCLNNSSKSNFFPNFMASLPPQTEFVNLSGNNLGSYVRRLSDKKVQEAFRVFPEKIKRLDLSDNALWSVGVPRKDNLTSSDNSRLTANERTQQAFFMYHMDHPNVASDKPLERILTNSDSVIKRNKQLTESERLQQIFFGLKEYDLEYINLSDNQLSQFNKEELDTILSGLLSQFNKEKLDTISGPSSKLCIGFSDPDNVDSNLLFSDIKLFSKDKIPVLSKFIEAGGNIEYNNLPWKLPLAKLEVEKENTEELETLTEDETEESDKNWANNHSSFFRAKRHSFPQFQRVLERELHRNPSEEDFKEKLSKFTITNNRLYNQDKRNDSDTSEHETNLKNTT